MACYKYLPLAVANGDLVQLELCLESNIPDIDLFSLIETTLASKASKSSKPSNQEVVSCLVDGFVTRCRAANNKHKSPLHVACEHDLRTILSLLLARRNVDFNEGIVATNVMAAKLRKTALYSAIDNDRVECAQMLMAYEPGVDLNDEEFGWLLETCCYDGKDKMFSCLMTYPKFQASKDVLLRCMFECAFVKNFSCLPAIMASPNFDVNYTIHERGKTALHLACNSGCVEAVKLLLSVPNIDVNAKWEVTIETTRNIQHLRPIDLARIHKHDAAVTLLSAHPAVDSSEIDLRYYEGCFV